MTNQSVIGRGPEHDRADDLMAEGFEGRVGRGVTTGSFAVTGRLPDGIQAVAAAAEMSRQLDGPLTALQLYIGEISRHVQQFARAGATPAYLQQVAQNALEQTERLCAVAKQFAGAHEVSGTAGTAEAGHAGSYVGVVPASTAGRKPLTTREREVLRLISEGCTNKQGARWMHISPRTFESHRAEAMRKLGARNTADLVRAALARPSLV